MGVGTLSKVIFQPPEPTYNKDPNLIWLHTREHEVIPAFFIDKDARYTLIFSHGNAEDLGMIIQYFRDVSDMLAVNIFAYEYTGYGMSTGSATEANVYADIEAAFKYLRDIVGVPWQDIVVYGRSIGSGPSCHLASVTPVRGVVLQCPLLSIYRIAFEFRYTLPGDQFANIDKISAIQGPIFIIHGTSDDIVPISHGKALYDMIDNPYEPFWVEGGGHNNLEIIAREPFFERFTDFIKYLDETPIPQALLNQQSTI
eukprot:GEMP01026094.1.p1 GENE.GEMP01026094.1~~GEMP01026094.1.p1  ORF type:complete len:256 (+),score=25.86 GEMP01026094.1:226-993(+)